MAGINPEFWKKIIKERLYEDVSFIGKSENADEYVMNGVAVHIPQAGAPMTVQRNPSYPLPIVQRGDTDVLYMLDNYAVGVQRIGYFEEAEISYLKKESVLRQIMFETSDFIARDTLRKWTDALPQTSRIATTGAALPTTLGGTTGTRKSIAPADILKAATMLDNQKISMKERYLLLSPDMYNQLVADTSLAYAFQNIINYKTGDLPELYGFKLMKYTQPIITDAADTVKLPEAAVATTDNVSAIFWCAPFVEVANGKVEVFQDTRTAQYQGDLVSLALRMGARRNRADNKGIGLITAKP